MSYISGHIHRLAKYYTLLWRQLTCPHPITVRFHIYETVILIEKLIYYYRAATALSSNFISLSSRAIHRQLIK